MHATTHLVVKSALWVLLLCFPLAASGADYRCTVVRKVDFDREYTPTQLKAGKFSNLVEETKDGTFVSRCSFVASEGRVSCDRFRMDRVEVDRVVKIKKLYVFDSQFNFQLFPNLRFVEDNGRGSVSFGRCKVIAP